MPNELRLDGFDELKKELTALPTAARDESRPIVSSHAERAAATLRGVYPSVTGDLRDGVQVIPRVGRGIAAVVTVRSSSAHAHLYEFGTYRSRPHSAFLPITEIERRRSTAAVVDVVEAHGLGVQAPND